MTRERTQVTDLDTGVVVEEVFRLNGKRHRDAREGPAFTARDAETGTTLCEDYLWYGRLHRADGPARVVQHSLLGTVLGGDYEEDLQGQLDPLVHLGVRRLGNTRDLSLGREYFWHGRRHRDPKDGPALIVRDKATGVVVLKSYWRGGVPHRDAADGPAIVYRSATTDGVIVEAYWVNGELHREPTDGPAIIKRDAATGDVNDEKYFSRGRNVAAPQRPGNDARGRGPDRDRSP